MAKISILTPCFNHEKYVSYFLQSVLEQSFSDFELIIVDDCSSDNSTKEIQKFKDPKIKLIKHE
ncbi:glycosyltransferase family 2 protein, partial [Campylobacter jejuni]|nr:glycosyltransferase family 2 protein [Campylobacter jejuni]